MTNNNMKWPAIEHNYDFSFAMVNFDKLTIDQCIELLSAGYSDTNYYQGEAMRHIERVLIILRANVISSNNASGADGSEDVTTVDDLAYFCNNTNALRVLIESVRSRISADPGIAQHLYMPTFIESIGGRFNEQPLENPDASTCLECLRLAINSFSADWLFTADRDDEMHNWVMEEVNNMISDFIKRAEAQRNGA